MERLANRAKVDRDTISEHVSTYLADADVMAQDDFEAFFAARARALLDQIASATGKAIDDLDLTNAADTEGPGGRRHRRPLILPCQARRPLLSLFRVVW